MKWNIEWIDLQNIERMIAECWRMNDRQLEQYYKKLSYRRELEFAGTLGIAFLELMHGIITGEADYDWSKLQKDVHMLQKLIQEGLGRDEEFWKKQYLEIMDEPSFYFYTELGRAFTDQLAVKLELHISEEQKLLHRDIQMIEKICEVCDFTKESDVEKALSILNRNEKNYFSSWLGESFVNTLQEQFAKKESETAETEFDNIMSDEIPLPEEPEPKPRRFLKKTKFLRILCVCLLLVSGGAWLFTQSVSGRIRLYLQQLSAAVKAITADTDEISVADNPDVPARLNKTENNSDDTNGSKKINMDLTKENVHVPDYAVEVELHGEDDEQEYKVRKNKTPDGAEQSRAEDTDTVPAPDILPQYQSFYNEHPDLFGWLKIPDTDIDVPVMQSDDEEKGEKYYYLHRDYNGKPSAEGSLFVDSRSSCYPQDQNTVIYGHNMSSGRIFGTLDRFTDPDFLKEHQDIQYDTRYETGEYRITAVLKTRILYQEEEGFRYYRFFNYDTADEFQECQEFINRNRLFDTGEELQYGDQILMLSTCEYSQENGRLVVVAKRTDGKEA